MAEPLDLTFSLVMILMRNGKAKFELLDLLVVGPEVVFPLLIALAYDRLGGLVSLVGDPELVGQPLGLCAFVGDGLFGPVKHGLSGGLKGLVMLRGQSEFGLRVFLALVDACLGLRKCTEEVLAVDVRL